MLAAEKLRFLVGVCIVTPVAADTGDDFSDNLFTDLAPLLALFGERVTMQFMSQSMGWADNIILAMAPLGIITAVVGAIRVGGPSWLKAIIGRARESRAIPESELMSSTSNEVCELWNGQEIVRVMGSGPIREFIILLPASDDEKAGQTKMATTPAKARSNSVNNPKDDLEVDQGTPVIKTLVMKLKDALKPKDNKSSKDGGIPKDYPMDYELTTRERIFSDHFLGFPWGLTPLKKLNEKKAKDDHHTSPSPQPDSETRGGIEDLEKGPLHRHTDDGPDSKTNTKDRPSIIIIRNTNNCAPNLTLNIHSQVGRGELYMVAILGIVLQFGVLVYCGLATRHLRLPKDGNPVNDYAFPCTASGTLLMVTGMLLCAHVVENSTEEKRYRPRFGRMARVVWLQRSGTVNDQDFKPFAIFPQDARALVTTSHRANGEQGPDGATENKFQESITVAGVLASLCGFIIQFTGLHGMHWSASVAQLAAIIIMTILRAWVRRNLAKNPKAVPLVAGHELDWLTMTFGNYLEAPWLHTSKAGEGTADRSLGGDNSLGWKIIAVEDPANCEGLVQHPSAAATTNTDGSKQLPHKNEGRMAAWGKCSDSCSSAYRLLKMRRDLGELAGWHGPASEEAISLARAIEIMMDTLFGPDSVGAEFTWSLTALKPFKESGHESVFFHVTRNEGKWKAYSDEIEAALSLWLYSVEERENGLREGEKKKLEESQDDENTSNTKKKGKSECPKDDAWLRANGTPAKPSLQLLGPYTAALYRDLQWWMPGGAVRVIEIDDPDLTDKSNMVEVEAHRVVGFASNAKTPPFLDLDICQYQRKTPESPCKDAPLAVESYSPLKTLYAQYMFSAFMWAASKTIEKPNENRADVRLAQKDSTSGGPAWQSITLHSTWLSKIAQDIQTTGLGNLEEIYQAIIPPLSASNNLPRADAIIEWTREHAKPQERLGHWKEAADAYLWLFQMAEAFPEQDSITTKATALLMEYLKALTDAIKLRKAQQFDKSDIQDLEKLKSSLDEKLQSASVDTLAGLMGLYEAQGRHWHCNLAQKSRPIEDKGATLKFTDLHKMALSGSWRIMERLEASKDGIDERDILDWTPLHYATMRLSPLSLQNLLKYRADVNIQDIRGRTPLHYACRRNDALMMQSLLREGAEINTQDIDGMAPIHYAAKYGCNLVIKSLIEAGADIDIVDGLGCTAFLWAAYRGHATTVKHLWGDTKTRLRDRNGRTPLHLAAIADVDEGLKRNEVVRLLLEKDATVKAAIRAKDRYGKTPLHLATESGQEAVMKLLLEKGAAIEAKDLLGSTPLHLAAESGQEAITKLLLESGATTEAKDQVGRTPLHLTAKSGQEAVMKLLLEKGATIEAKDLYGNTPLHLATESGQEAVMKLLLENGAATEAKDQAERTPLHLATESRQGAVMKLLLEKGATIEAKDLFGRTPLHLAAESRQGAVVELLLEKGAAIEAKDLSGRTPLHLAAESRHGAVVKLLLEKGAAIEAKNWLERTPLHLAAESRHGAVVKLLLEKGAAIEAKDRERRTPLHLAAEKGQEAVVKLLLEKGAAIEVKDLSETTPLHLAAKSGQEAVVKLLGRHRGEGSVGDDAAALAAGRG